MKQSTEIKGELLDWLAILLGYLFIALITHYLLLIIGIDISTFKLTALLILIRIFRSLIVKGGLSG